MISRTGLPPRLLLPALLAAILLALTGQSALAHSFTAAVHAVGPDRATQLASAVRGFRVATMERDGHADEESDGHLGGLDVYIVPRPTEAADAISGIVGLRADETDFVVVIGPDPAAGQVLAGVGDDPVALRSGTLPPMAQWSGEAGPPDGFAARYRDLYGVWPDRAAAEGYNAARRIDLAVREQGGVDDRAALRASLARTRTGFEW